MKAKRSPRPTAVKRSSAKPEREDTMGMVARKAFNIEDRKSGRALKGAKK